MRAKYYGKIVIRNEFGDVVHRFPPRVTITFSEKELALVEARLVATGYKYDIFIEGTSGFDVECAADVYISDKEEANEFMEVWREVKRRIKKAN